MMAASAARSAGRPALRWRRGRIAPLRQAAQLPRMQQQQPKSTRRAAAAHGCLAAVSRCTPPLVVSLKPTTRVPALHALRAEPQEQWRRARRRPCIGGAAPLQATHAPRHGRPLPNTHPRPAVPPLPLFVFSNH
ncbi:hypothetical protein ABPG75_004436 [Micractinium tetrahymenae]